MTDSQEKAWHQIFQGMSAGGINGPETWTEYVCYEGNGCWKLFVDSHPESLSSTNSFNSAELGIWAMERDYEEVDREAGERDEREQNLLEIAKTGLHDDLLTILNGLRDGSWPPPPKILRITKIYTVSRWRGIRITMFEALTDHGVGSITSPNQGGWVTLSAEAFGATRSWRITLTNEQLEVIRDLQKANIDNKT